MKIWEDNNDNKEELHLFACESIQSLLTIFDKDIIHEKLIILNLYTNF